jgi:hypothetical protein
MQPVKREALTAAQQAVVQDIEAEHKVQDTLLDQMADAALTLTTRAHHINDELQKSDAVRSCNAFAFASSALHVHYIARALQLQCNYCQVLSAALQRTSMADVQLSRASEGTRNMLEKACVCRWLSMHACMHA